MGKEIASSNLTAGVYQPGTNQAAMRLEGNQSALAVPGARLAFFPHSSRPADRALIKRSRATSADLVAHRSSRRAPSPRDGLDFSLEKSCEKKFQPAPSFSSRGKDREISVDAASVLVTLGFSFDLRLSDTVTRENHRRKSIKVSRETEWF